MIESDNIFSIPEKAIEDVSDTLDKKDIDRLVDCLSLKKDDIRYKVFVPYGDDNDETRLPQIYDGIYSYFKKQEYKNYSNRKRRGYSAPFVNSVSCSLLFRLRESSMAILLIMSRIILSSSLFSV